MGYGSGLLGVTSNVQQQDGAMFLCPEIVTIIDTDMAGVSLYVYRIM